MKQTRLIMGMPITIEIIDPGVTEENLQEIFNYFQYIDDKFSTYKSTSEISQINACLLLSKDFSQDMQTVLRLCEQTKKETSGYFDISHNGKLDPSGLVKGWAIYQAANLLKKKGFSNFYVEAGGDIQVAGKNKDHGYWTIGIRNPFNREEIIKKLKVFDKGVATSGTYIRGQHVYNPKVKDAKLEEVVSLTVIGPNIYEADRFATAAFAMGKRGIHLIEKLPEFAGYLVDKEGTATFTSNFKQYL
ncbi:MAG TPA: FAD:protein FMN transferase [Patescibacteria group bacterium]